eukprot:1158793-Pelagomonas_calceolata.AAC.4
MGHCALRGGRTCNVRNGWGPHRRCDGAWIIRTRNKVSQKSFIPKGLMSTGLRQAELVIIERQFA